MFDARPVRLDQLTDYENPEFFVQLELAPANLTGDQIDSFFKVALKHSRSKCPRDTAKTILRTLYDVLTDPPVLGAFASGWFAAALPFARVELIDDILNILWLLASRAPSAFDDSLARSVRRLIPERPAKVLHLIARYLLSADEGPSPMAALLLDESDVFSQAETIVQFGQLLSYAATGFSAKFGNSSFEREQFAKKFGDPAFKICCKLLKTAHHEVLPDLYNSVCLVAQHLPTVALPLATLKLHLKIAPAQPGVLQLLLLGNVKGVSEELNDRFLTRPLIRLAGAETAACFVLMRMAKADTAFSESLVADGSWMERDLPKVVYTLCLFLVVFQGPEEWMAEAAERRRRLIAAHRMRLTTEPGFAALLCRLVACRNEAINSVIVTVLRRVQPLPAALVRDLSECKFIEDFMRCQLELGTQAARIEYLRLLQTIGRSVYTRELIAGCRELTRMIVEETDVAAPACRAAIDLCREPKCVRLFKDRGLVDYFLRQRASREMRAIADEFLRATEIERG
jgi:hypothetical protein